MERACTMLHPLFSTLKGMLRVGVFVILCIGGDFICSIFNTFNCCMCFLIRVHSQHDNTVFDAATTSSSIESRTILFVGCPRSDFSVCVIMYNVVLFRFIIFTTNVNRICGEKSVVISTIYVRLFCSSTGGAYTETSSHVTFRLHTHA